MVIKQEILQKQSRKPGLNREEFNSLKASGYHSARIISSWNLKNGNIGAIQTNMIGTVNNAKTKYTIIIDFRQFPAELPQAYVRTPLCPQINHPNIYRQDWYDIAPRIPLCAICFGDYEYKYKLIKRDRKKRLRFFFHQLNAILSNPNYGSKARG